MGQFRNNDLPERFDPMTAKELRQSLRRGSFVLPFCGIHLLALVAIGTEFRNGHAAATSDHVGMLNPWLLGNSGPFWMVVGAVCVVIMPLGGLVLMGQELDEGNHELLQLTGLKRWKIVFGKFIALWGLSALTFVSLLPYVVLRYLVGGIEWWHEAACAATVLCGSAMIGAGAIGASSFRGTGARVLVFFLYLASMLAGCAAPLFGSALVTGGCGILYHLTALAAAAAYTLAGLAMARSRLRLAFMTYEMKPGGMIVAMLVFAPFFIGIITALTAGFGGIAGLLLVALIANRLDVTPKGPAVPESW